MQHLKLTLLSTLAILAAAPQLRAEDPGASSSIEIGAAYGRVSFAGKDADMAGYGVGFKTELGKFFADLSLEGDYRHLSSSGTTSVSRDDADLDLRFGMSVAGILKPYVSAGLSVDRNTLAAYSPESSWNMGYAVGAGVGITVIPGLLHTTPSVRYVQSNKLDTMTYSLDTALHFTLIGVGARLDYEDNLSRDGHLMSATLYAGLRF